MNAILTGVICGIIVIVFLALLKRIDKQLMYSYILTGIGFLYVGFAWSDTQALVINSIQAIIFVFLSYYGVKRSAHILSFGFFLHGAWDMVYHYFSDSSLIPAHYDLFCLSIDFTMGIYLVLLSRLQSMKQRNA